MAEGRMTKDSLNRLLLPDGFEIYSCDDATGNISAIPLGGIVTKRDLYSAYNALRQDPSHLDSKLILVLATRRIIGGNFDWKHELGSRLPGLRN